MNESSFDLINQQGNRITLLEQEVAHWKAAAEAALEELRHHRHDTAEVWDLLANVRDLIRAALDIAASPSLELLRASCREKP